MRVTTPQWTSSDGAEVGDASTSPTPARRRGGADIEQVPPPPAPPLDTWAPALLDSVAAHLGQSVRYASGPEPSEDRSQGPWAYPFELATSEGELPSEWQGRLMVRLADSDTEVRREETALEFCAAHDLGAPAVLTGLDLGDVPQLDDEPRATHALVTSMPDLVPLPELIGFNLRYSDELLGGFARAHAALHDCDPSGLEASIPILSIADELDRIDEAPFTKELAWLREHTPPTARPVLCHGGYQPMCASGPPPDRWKELGGPGSGLVAGNWTGAVLAEREFDVGFTLACFWMAPYFAPDRSERTALKLIRNTLSNRYRLEYTAVAPLDLDALRFWLAFHAVRGMARLADAYDYTGSLFAAPERGNLPSVIGPELGRLFKMQRRG